MDIEGWRVSTLFRGDRIENCSARAYQIVRVIYCCEVNAATLCLFVSSDTIIKRWMNEYLYWDLASFLQPTSYFCTKGEPSRWKQKVGRPFVQKVLSLTPQPPWKLYGNSSHNMNYLMYLINWSLTNWSVMYLCFFGYSLGDFFLMAVKQNTHNMALYSYNGWREGSNLFLWKFFDGRANKKQQYWIGSKPLPVT